MWRADAPSTGSWVVTRPRSLTPLAEFEKDSPLLSNKGAAAVGIISMWSEFEKTTKTRAGYRAPPKPNYQNRKNCSASTVKSQPAFLARQQTRDAPRDKRKRRQQSRELNVRRKVRNGLPSDTCVFAGSYARCVLCCALAPLPPRVVSFVCSNLCGCVSRSRSPAAPFLLLPFTLTRTRGSGRGAQNNAPPSTRPPIDQNFEVYVRVCGRGWGWAVLFFLPPRPPPPPFSAPTPIAFHPLLLCPQSGHGAPSSPTLTNAGIFPGPKRHAISRRPKLACETVGNPRGPKIRGAERKTCRRNGREVVFNASGIPGRIRSKMGSLASAWPFW